MLYCLWVTIDFWEEIACYHLGWQIGTSHKASLLVRFIGGQTGKSNKSIMLVEFSSLPHGLELLGGMSMTKMHLQRVNWQCHGHRGCQSF